MHFDNDMGILVLMWEVRSLLGMSWLHSVLKSTAHRIWGESNMDSRDLAEKLDTVLKRNTYFYYNQSFEDSYENDIHGLKQLLLTIKSNVSKQNVDPKEAFCRILETNSNGLEAVMALTGLSQEYIKRLISFIRIVQDPELDALVNAEDWRQTGLEGPSFREWSTARIQAMLRQNPEFRDGLVNLLFEGATVKSLSDVLPTFELKKLDRNKLTFDGNAMIDTIVRYRQKGSRAASAANNAENAIRELLDEISVTYESGDLPLLKRYAEFEKRSMDFLIPCAAKPKLIVECSYLVTTSSGQGDKSKTELAVAKLIKRHYEDALFVGIVDGIGWLVRRQDLRRMVEAYDDVFTLHSTETNRFKSFVKEAL